jgi:hypothetical protein
VATTAGLLTGMSEHIAFVVRYTGSFTHLLSNTLAVVAVLAGIAFIDGRRWMIGPFALVYALAVFAKEDVPAFVVASLSLYAGLRYVAGRQWRIAARGALAVVITGGITVAALSYNLSRPGSFIDVTLKGTDTYGLVGSPGELVRHVGAYLTFGRLSSIVALLYVICAVAWMVRLSGGLAVRFLCFVPLVVALVLPYALLQRSHMYGYYTIIWLPLIAASTVLGYLVIARSAGVSRSRVTGVALAMLVVVALVSTPRRNAVAAWMTMHQTQNERILRELERHSTSLSGEHRVWVRGLDRGFSPFFYTDAEYLNRRLGTPRRVWVILVSPGSFVATAYASSGQPRTRRHVILAEDGAGSGGSDRRPLIDFDADFRATVLR